MHFTFARQVLAVLIVCAVVAVGAGAYISHLGAPRGYLLMATTTSTRDTGLLAHLLPAFTADTGIDVRYTAVGTGQALDAGRRGDVDVVMVHAPALEAAFLAEGHGACRNLVMYNRFVLVGPAGDPAGVAGSRSIADAFSRIAANATRFDSRGDGSGTHAKELEVWALAGLDPAGFGAWYEETDQGMGATLAIANQRDAYALSDDGTWYALEPDLPFLRLLLSRNEPMLRNQYSVIPVDPGLHPAVLAGPGGEFARWLVAARAQGLIGSFAVNGHPIFTPNAADNASNPEACA